MTREEWYAHTILDHIQAVSEYIDIVRDGAVETDLTNHELDQLYSFLITLNHDINCRLETLAK